jgi:Skp family chaperone for outer membrane proteins
MNDQLTKWGVLGLAIWVAVLTWMVATQPGANSPRHHRGGTGPVVAYVHGDSLQQGMHLLQNLQANLMAQIETREAQLQQEAKPLQEEAQELLAYANSGQATDDELSIAQSRVMEIEAQLGQMQRIAESQIVQAEQNMQAVIAEALRRELEAFAKEEGIDMILNWGLSGEGVLYGGEPMDITPQVLDRLNANHPLTELETPAD